MKLVGSLVAERVLGSEQIAGLRRVPDRNYCCFAHRNWPENSSFAATSTAKALRSVKAMMVAQFEIAKMFVRDRIENDYWARCRLVEDAFQFPFVVSELVG